MRLKSAPVWLLFFSLCRNFFLSNAPLVVKCISWTEPKKNLHQSYNSLVWDILGYRDAQLAGTVGTNHEGARKCVRCVLLTSADIFAVVDGRFSCLSLKRHSRFIWSSLRFSLNLRKFDNSITSGLRVPRDLLISAYLVLNHKWGVRKGYWCRKWGLW